MTPPTEEFSWDIVSDRFVAGAQLLGPLSPFMAEQLMHRVLDATDMRQSLPVPVSELVVRMLGDNRISLNHNFALVARS